jgi:ElaA protein
VQKTQRITLEWHRFADMPAALLYEVLRFRQAIFVVEQASPYGDIDGRDEPARHLLLRADRELAGYLRLISEEGCVRIGRVAVAPARRGRGLARRMMEEALRVAAALHPGCDVAIGAQAHLAPFYASLGFAPVSEVYDDVGVPHIDMVRRADPHSAS